MSASMAAAIRRHVEELGVWVRWVWVHPDDERAVVADLDGVVVVVDEDVPRGCWKVEER